MMRCIFFPERSSTPPDSAADSRLCSYAVANRRYNKVIVDDVPVNDPGGII